MITTELKLREIFCKILGIENNDSINAFAYGKTEKWDSMAHILLINEIEHQFGVSLATDDMLEMTTLAEIIRVLREHGIDI